MGILVVPIASRLRPPGVAEGVAERIARALSGVEVLPRIVDGYEVLREVPDADAYVALVLTGGSEHLVLELGLRRAPMLLVAHDSQNSLAAAVEALTELRRRGVASTLVLYSQGSSELGKALRALRAYVLLRGGTIVLIGDPSPWLVYSSRGLEAATELLGLRPLRIGVEELVERLRSADQGEVRRALERLRGAEVVDEASGYLEKAAALYVALRSILDELGGRVFTIRCFDLLKHGVTACLALSMLNDEGYVAGCEGDVPAAVTMALLARISGSPAFMGNVAWVDGRRVFLAHCTVPTRIVGGYRLRTHFESGIGVGVEGYPRRGEEVTIARLDPLRRVLRAAVGVVENSGPIRGDWCRTQFAVRISGDPSPLVLDPIGNHYALVPGVWLGELGYLAQLMGVELQVPGGA